MWDFSSDACVAVGLRHTRAVRAVAFSKKKRNFFVSGGRYVNGFIGIVVPVIDA